MNFQKLFFKKNGKHLTIWLWSLILIDQINEKLFKKLTWVIKKNTAHVTSLSDLRETQEMTDEYVKKFTADWLELEIDVLVCPSFPVPAVPHRYPSQLGQSVYLAVIGWVF